jgi:hypothetical protein
MLRVRFIRTDGTRAKRAQTSKNIEGTGEKRAPVPVATGCKFSAEMRDQRG